MNANHLLSFKHSGKTYLFGLTPSPDAPPGPTKMKSLDNAANWWVINDDPKTGFTPVVQGARMSSEYHHLTSFALNGHPYIFGLHGVGANIWRINDDPKTGFELVMYKGKMSYGNRVVSFQLKGEPYILGLHWDGGANIWRIKDEGAKGLTFNLLTKYKAKMSPNYEYLKVFYMGGHPYVFGLHTGESGVGGVGANIWRIKDDPSKGFDLVTYGAKFPRTYNFVLPFHLGGRPYLLGVVSENYMKEEATDLIQLDQYEPGSGGNVIGSLIKVALIGLVEWGKGYGCIWEIVAESNSLSINKISKSIPISHKYTKVITFEQAGKAYMFGIHEEGYANIWRINDDPKMGFALDHYGRDT